MSPHEDAEETDEERCGDHSSVGEDSAAAEVGKDHGSEAHAGKDGDVDLGVSEEPEEMQPEERRAVAGEAGGVDDSADEIAGGDEKAGAEMAIAEE